MSISLGRCSLLRVEPYSCRTSQRHGVKEKQSSGNSYFIHSVKCCRYQIKWQHIHNLWNLLKWCEIKMIAYQTFSSYSVCLYCGGSNCTVEENCIYVSLCHDRMKSWGLSPWSLHIQLEWEWCPSGWAHLQALCGGSSRPWLRCYTLQSCCSHRYLSWNLSEGWEIQWLFVLSL